MGLAACPCLSGEKQVESWSGLLVPEYEAAAQRLCLCGSKSAADPFISRYNLCQCACMPVCGVRACAHCAGGRRSCRGGVWSSRRVLTPVTARLLCKSITWQTHAPSLCYARSFVSRGEQSPPSCLRVQHSCSKQHCEGRSSRAADALQGCCTGGRMQRPHNMAPSAALLSNKPCNECQCVQHLCAVVPGGLCAATCGQSGGFLVLQALISIGSRGAARPLSFCAQPKPYIRTSWRASRLAMPGKRRSSAQ